MARFFSARRVGIVLATGAIAWSWSWSGALRQAEAIVTITGLENVDELSLQTVYPDFPYWNNVGQVGVNGSGVYLGNGIVLTATHVNAQSTFILDDIEYSMSPVPTSPEDSGGDRGSLDNPESVLGSLTEKSDIRLWQLNGGVELDLTPIPIVANKAAVGNEVVMIGTGVITIEPDGPAPYTLGDDDDRVKLWGDNKVVSVFDNFANPGDPNVPNIFGRNVITFSITFNTPGALALDNEAQATPGDSGSPAFLMEDGVWKLAGVAHSITGTAGQVAFNDKTAISDLSYYDDQINGYLYNLGDVNQDFTIDDADIDAIFAAIAISEGELVDPYDLNDDDVLDLSDVETLVRGVLATEFGDANLDGLIDGDDFRVLKDHINLAGGWSQGDFNGDTLVDLSDYQIFRDNFGFGIEGTGPLDTPLVVPSPTSLSVLALAGLLALRRKRAASIAKTA